MTPLTIPLTTPSSSQPIPFLADLPLLGSVFALKKDRLGLLERVATLGKVSGFHMGTQNIVVFNEPQFLQSLFVEHAKDFTKGWNMRRAFVGNGVFISEGDFHTKQRKIMAPSFQPRQVAQYAEIMASYGEHLVTTWQHQQEINVSQQMNVVTMGIIGKVLFDEEMFSEADELGKSLLIVFDHAAHLVTSLFAPPGHWPTPYNRAKDRAWSVIYQRIQRMIDERRAHPSTHGDFLSLLMNARDEDDQPMADEQVVDEASTLFSGGQETVANTLTWVWYLLCQHPEISQAVQEEVDRVLQGRPPCLSDVPHLPLCLQVVKEALRLYSPAPGVIRQAIRECVIEDQERSERYVIPKGTTVIASIHAIHHMASLYPEPDRFLPTVHFAPDAEKRLPRYGFVPFGAGPRICIGNHFAMLEAHLLLATLAQRVTFTLVPGQTIFPSSRTLTTKPEHDIRVIVQRR